MNNTNYKKKVFSSPKIEIFENISKASCSMIKDHVTKKYRWDDLSLRGRCLEHLKAAFYAKTAGVKKQFNIHRQEAIDLFFDDCAEKISLFLDRIRPYPHGIPRVIKIPIDLNENEKTNPLLLLCFMYNQILWFCYPLEEYSDLVPSRALKSLIYTEKIYLPFEELCVASPPPEMNYMKDPWLIGRLGSRNWIVIDQWI